MSDVTETIVRRTIELAEVPAPTGSEEERSAMVRSWWELDGLAEVRVDGSGNVWGRARDGDGPIVILCAHLDTVFGADVPHTVRVDGDLLIGPSVGDDSVAVAALSPAGMALQDGPLPVWLLATVGEEGLGNLRGVIAALDGPPGSVAAFLAVEGNYLGRVSTIGVGSVRRRIRVTGPGGHAWEDAEVPSAVHHLARVVTSITSAPRRSGTSVNVGRIGGGEGINLRAAEAWFDLDLRADDPDELASLARAVDEIARQAEPPLVVEQELLGERPAGRIERDHPLVRAAEQALDEVAIPVSTPRDEHGCERRARARDPRDRGRRHEGLRRAHAARVDRDRPDRDRRPDAGADDRAIRRAVDVSLRSGVVLQGAYPPAEFRSMVERIDDLGYSNLWLTDSSLHARNSVRVPRAGGDGVAPVAAGDRRHQSALPVTLPSRRSRPPRWTRSPVAG